MNNVEMPVPNAGLLPHLGVLRFAGPDATTFLQGQLSNDVRRLATAQPLLAACSNPQGRVLALMHLLPHSSGILAVLPREVVIPTLEWLRKFVLRAKVQPQDVSEEFAVAGAYQAAALDGTTGYVEVAGVGMARLGGTPGIAAGVHVATGGPHRSWWVGHRATLVARGVDAESDAAEFERAWRLADIRAGLAQIYLPTREMFVAQMLNLDLVDGISFTKGCFTGQEIIARTQHLGRIKRRLHRLRLPAGNWGVGQALHLQDGRTGRVTEVVSADDGYEALVVLRSAQDDAGGESADAPGGARVDAVELSLPYALTQER